MWVARNKATHELVAVVDENPFALREDERDDRIKKGTILDEIDHATEEVVELPGKAEDIHAAVREAGEVTSVKVPNTGPPQVTPYTGPRPAPLPDALAQVVAEQRWTDARPLTVGDLRRILDRTQGRA